MKRKGYVSLLIPIIITGLIIGIGVLVYNHYAVSVSNKIYEYELSLERNDTKTAMKACKKVQSRFSDNQIGFIMEMEVTKYQDIDSFIKVNQKFQQRFPESYFAKVYEINEARAKKQYKGTLKLMDEFYKEYPEKEFMPQVSSYFEQKTVEESFMENAYASSYAHVKILHGLILEEQNQLDKSIQILKSVENYESTMTAPNHPSVPLHICRIYANTKNYTEAEKCLKRYEGIIVQSLMTQAMNSLFFGSDNPLENMTLEERQNLFGAQYYEASGILQTKRKKYDGAEKFLKIALKMGAKTNAIHESLGECYLQQGKLDDAEKKFKEVIKKAPDSSAPYIGLAKLYHQRGLTYQAHENLKKVISSEPDNLAAYEYRIKIYKDSNELEKALADNELLIEKAPKNRKYAIMKYLTLMKMHHFKEAEKAMAPLITAYPKNTFYRLKRVCASYGCQNYDYALSDLSTLVNDPKMRTKALIWTQLCKLSAGKEIAHKQLQKNIRSLSSQKIKCKKWELATLKYLSTKPEKKMPITAGYDRSSKWFCSFVMGIEAQAEGDTGKARECFEQCVKNGLRNQPHVQIASALLEG